MPVSDKHAKALLEKAKQDQAARDFFYWVREPGLITLDGKPFSFHDHEYLVGIYDAMSDPDIVDITLQKAGQMGLTVAEVLECFHGMKYGRYPKGVLYLLPTERHMERVSKTKIQPIIDENPNTLQKWISKTESTVKRASDSTTQKSIGGANFILHGMSTTHSLISFSVDSIRFDELEEIEKWNLVEKALVRQSHSEVEWQGRTIKGGTIHRFSVPSLPNFGIDEYFSGKESDSGFGWDTDPSDQRYWLIKCEACGEYTCLEDEFPECIVEIDRKAQKAIRVCKKCRREIKIWNGEWVAKKPGQRGVGFHISQLFSAIVNPWTLLDQYRKKKSLKTLYNDKLGMTYIEANARLEIAEVLALCGSQRPVTSFPGPCSMGIDQPKEEGQHFHVVIGYKKSDQLKQVIFTDTRTTWADLGNLMNTFHVSRCVVDGLPNQDKARELARSFPGKVFLSYYGEKQKGAYLWNEDNWTVSIDRTESLNASTTVIHEGKVIFPQISEEMKVFAKHCRNMARKSVEDKDTKVVRHVWVKTGADHYRHAWNYCMVAMEDIAVYRDITNFPPPVPRVDLGKSYAIRIGSDRKQGGGFGRP